jgi:glycosyltransferase involved in cell wall biosynthesis
MTARNDSATIKAAIFSVLSQTHEDLELIVIDDCSSDDSLKIVKSIKDPRIKVIFNTKNLGPGPSRNLGLNAATGTWFAVIDADDLWTPDRLEYLLDLQSDFSSPCIVSDSILEIDLEKRRSNLIWRDLFEEEYRSRQVQLHEYIGRRRNIIAPLIPMEIIVRHKISYPNILIGEDLFFYVAVLTAENLPILIGRKPCYIYQRRNQRLTSNPDRILLLVKAVELCIETLRLDDKQKYAFTRKAEHLKDENHYLETKKYVRSRQFLKAIYSMIKRPKNLVVLLRQIF